MKVVIIGAGIGGLGAAAYFSERGHTVEVVEASDRPGGRAVNLSRPATGDCVDAGTQYFHSNYTRALGLIRQAGLEGGLARVTGYTRIFSDKVSSGSFLLNHRLPWYTSGGISGNLQLGYFLFSNLLKYPMDSFGDRPQPQADKLDGLRQSINPLVRESIVRPLALTGALSEAEEMEISLLHVLRLIRIILMTDYLSLTGGTASLHEALAGQFDLSLESPVSRIVVENERVAGIEIQGSGRVIEADHVVIATTPPPAMAIIPRDWNEERQYLESIRIPSFVLPTFFLNRPLQKNVWSYLMKEDPQRLIAFITDASQKNPAMVPSGNAVIQPWICYPQSLQLLSLADDVVIELCIKELEEVFPGFASWIDEVHISHHKYAVPFSSIGSHQRSLDFLDRADKRGVSFCGDYLTGGYMESALWSAERAARTHG